jgi:hypothetical protein
MSTPSPRTIPEQVSFEQASQINVSAEVSLSHGKRQTHDLKSSWQQHSAQWLLFLLKGCTFRKGQTEGVQNPLPQRNT